MELERRLRDSRLIFILLFRPSDCQISSDFDGNEGDQVLWISVDGVHSEDVATRLLTRLGRGEEEGSRQ